MGWDITYHPLAPTDVADIYFVGLDDPAVVEKAIGDFGIDPPHADRLRAFFEKARNLNPDHPFPQTHGFFIAIIAGFLRPYWYCRDGALSFLYEDPAFQPYFSDWKDLVPSSHSRPAFENGLLCNFCGGVYLSPEAVAALKHDLDEKPDIREKLTALFSAAGLDVFREAMDHAIDNGLGLYEAAEVIRPEPLNLERTACYAIFENCTLSGLTLYRRTTLERPTETGSTAANNPANGSPRPGFFRRLWNDIFYRPE